MSNSKNNTPPPRPNQTPSLAEIQAQLAALMAENEALKAKKGGGGGRVSVKSSCFVGDKTNDGKDGKGTVGVYGMGRFPVSAYANQWAKVLKHSDVLATYIIDNASRLGFKEGQQESTIRFLEAAMPHLEAIANIDLG